MAWADIERWRKMTSRDLAAEAGFPDDCDAVYVNNCYELAHVPAGEFAEMDAADYARFRRGEVFEMLFQVHYEFLSGPDDISIPDDDSRLRCRSCGRFMPRYRGSR